MRADLQAEVRARVDAAASYDALVQSLAPAFVDPGLGDGESVFLAEPTTLAVVEARLTPTGLDHRSLVVGDDVGPVWVERLSRARHIGAAAAALERLEGGLPIALEILPRLQRWYLPSSGRVVELRGRRDVDGVRVLEVDVSRVALDAWLRVQPDMASVVSVFGAGDRAMGPWLVAAGRVAVAPDTVGFRALWGEALCRSVSAGLDGATIARIDAAVASSVRRYGRRESVGRDGATVAWSLPALGIVVSWSEARGTAVASLG